MSDSGPRVHEDPPRSRRAAIALTIALAFVVAIVLIGRSLTTALIGVIYPSDATSAVPPRPSYGTLWHLEDPDPAIRIKTIQVLAKKPDARWLAGLSPKELADVNAGRQFVLKAISEVLVNDPDPDVRLQAAESLAGTTPTPNILPDLVSALSDTQPEVREHVIVALSNLGAEAYSCLPRLQEIAELPDEEQTVREAAEAAIVVISEDAEVKYSID